MRLRCPVCHADASIEAWAQSDAAREMMRLIASVDDWLGRPLLAYVGLFRSSARPLAWDRALRIAREALALCADQQTLGTALAETVEAMRAKRQAGDVRPLENHNYLKKVIESVLMRGGAPSDPCAERSLRRAQAPSRVSRTIVAMLEDDHG